MKEERVRVVIFDGSNRKPDNSCKEEEKSQ